jgi:three-Cys-motif partner protein
MSKQEKFYHPDTERKLEAIERYLTSYLSVMSRQSFETVYIDAFAGTGVLPTLSSKGLFADQLESSDFVLGSALRALRLPLKFGKYVFIDDKKSKVKELRERVANFAEVEKRIEIIQGDAGKELVKLCNYLSKPMVRGVVFLDPFGNQVGWKVLEALGNTRHVDLWYLFPAMLGVYRQIGNDGAKMRPEQVASLNHIFGPHDWRSAFIERRPVNDLFGPSEVDVKIADVEDITRFMIGCLGGVFEGGVSDRWLPLGRDGAHWYSLIFAMANPSSAAVNAGHRIANHILSRK